MSKIEELLAMNASKQAKVAQVESASNISYLLLAKQGSKVLNSQDNENYLAGVKVGDFYIAKEKLSLPSKVYVTPIGWETVYSIYEDKTYVGKMSEQEALRLPLAQGAFYDRDCGNGRIATPSHVVYVRCHNIENQDYLLAISYKKSGAKIYKEWLKDIASRGSSSAILCYSLTAEEQHSGSYSWLDIKPTYHNNLVDMGKTDNACQCLEASNALWDKIASSAPAQATPVAQISAPAQATPVATIADINDEEIPF